MATVTSRLATFLRKTEPMSKKNNKKKKKKEKVIYVDDGSTIADMSAIGGGRRTMNINERGGCRAQWETYTKACRKMLMPMLVTMGGICVVFLIIYLLLLLAG